MTTNPSELVKVRLSYFSISIGHQINTTPTVASKAAALAVATARTLGHHEAEAEVVCDRRTGLTMTELRKLNPYLGQDVLADAVYQSVDSFLRSTET